MGLLDAHAPTWLPIDAQTGARIVIDHDVNEVHEGNAFFANYTKILSTGSSIAILVTTPATGNIDFNAQADASLAGYFTFSENPEASAGSALTVFNSKRTLPNSSSIIITGTPVITSVGTILEAHYVGTSGEKGISTGGNSGVRYIELANSTKYLVQFTADLATTRSSINVMLHID